MLHTIITGMYTVPSDGLYQFSIHLTSNAYLQFTLYVNNERTHYDLFLGDAYRGTTLLLELRAGDEVYVRAYWGSESGILGDDTDLETYISGYRLSP